VEIEKFGGRLKEADKRMGSAIDRRWECLFWRQRHGVQDAVRHSSRRKDDP